LDGLDGRVRTAWTFDRYFGLAGAFSVGPGADVVDLDAGAGGVGAFAGADVEDQVLRRAAVVAGIGADWGAVPVDRVDAGFAVDAVGVPAAAPVAGDRVAVVAPAFEW